MTTNHHHKGATMETHTVTFTRPQLEDLLDLLLDDMRGMTQDRIDALVDLVEAARADGPHATPTSTGPLDALGVALDKVCGMYEAEADITDIIDGVHDLCESRRG